MIIHLGKIVFAALFLFPVLSYAATSQDIEKHLNSLKTLQANFTQENADGTISTGVFYLKRPDRLKFVYTQPAGYAILAKDGWLTFYDPDLNEESVIELDVTPARFFLKDSISFHENVKVKNLIHYGETLHIVLSDPEETVELSLIYLENPLQLIGWRVLDVQGNITTVRLNQFCETKDIPDEIFQRSHSFKSRRDR